MTIKLRQKNTLLFCYLSLAICFSFSPSSVSASDATQQLQSALHRLNARLGTGDNAEGWRRYLHLNILETQAAKGEQADIATLQSIHSRFASGAYGLDHPIFSDVRFAIERQIANLSASYVGDLGSAVANAASQYQPITIDKMRYYRDQVINEFEALQHHYRTNLPSAERAEAFFELKLDETTELLKSIEFELAPEVSVGKMDSAIRQVQEQLDEVVKKIDALPFDSEGQGNQAAEGGQEVPVPDNEVSVEDLRKQQENLQQRISELQEQRREIRKQDLPRLRKRARTFVQLRKFETVFEGASKKYGDPYFVSSRLALERFVRAYYYGTDDNLQEDFLLRIQKLAEEVPNLQFADDRQTAGAVGNTLEWLENAFQVPHLVTAIRSRYSLPNAYATVSSSFLNRVGSQTLTETQPVNETLLGRLVRGCATSVGTVTFDMQNDPNQVHVSLHLNANVNSSTYVRQGRITAYINSTGLAEFRRSLYANIGGFFVDNVYGGANVNSCFRGTSCNLRLVDRIGQKQFDESKYRGEAEAADRISGEVKQRFTDQTNDAIAEGRKTLAEAKAKISQKSNLVPEIYAHSKTDKIVVVAKRSTKATLAAPNYPVEYAHYSDVCVRAHETLLSNFVDPIFRGKTFTDEELADELESILGTRPDALAPKAEDDEAAKDQSFSITFTNIRPIQFEFENNGLAVVVSGQRFSQGDSKIDEGLKIIIRFKIQRVNGKLKLARDGRAEIDYVDPDKKSPRTVAFRSFLDGRLNPKDAADAPSIDLPDNLIPVDEVEALKNSPVARKLFLSQCRVEGGWLYLGWNYVEATNYISMTVDTPAIENVPIANPTITQPMGTVVPGNQIIAPSYAPNQ